MTRLIHELTFCVSFESLFKQQFGGVFYGRFTCEDLVARQGAGSQRLCRLSHQVRIVFAASNIFSVWNRSAGVLAISLSRALISRSLSQVSVGIPPLILEPIIQLLKLLLFWTICSSSIGSKYTALPLASEFSVQIQVSYMLSPVRGHLHHCVLVTSGSCRSVC